MSRRSNTKQLEKHTEEFKEKLLLQLKDIHKNKKDKLSKQYKLQAATIKTIEEEIIKKMDLKEKQINDMKRKIDKINRHTKTLEKIKEEVSKDLKNLKKSLFNKIESERKKTKLKNEDVQKELSSERKKLVNKVTTFKPIQQQSLNKLKS